MERFLTKEEIERMSPEERIRYYEELKQRQQKEIDDLEQQKRFEIEKADQEIAEANQEARQKLDEQLLLLMENMPESPEEPHEAQQSEQPLEEIAGQAPEETPESIDYQAGIQGYEQLYSRLNELQEEQSYLLKKDELDSQDVTTAQEIQAEIRRIQGYDVHNPQVRGKIDKVMDYQTQIEQAKRHYH